MSGEVSIPLLQMFSLCPLEGKLLALAEKCTIRSVNLDKLHTAVTVDIQLAPGADDTWLASLEQALCAAYRMNRVTLRPVEREMVWSMTLDWLQEQFSQLFPPAYGILSGAELAEQGNLLLLTLASGGKDMLAPFVPRVENRIFEYFGRRCVLNLRENPAAVTSAEEAFRRTEALRNETVKKSAEREQEKPRRPDRPRENTPPPEETSKTFLGKPIHGAPTEIGKLDIDMGGVVINGKVFAVHHKELSKRNAWIISFDITDGTGSVTVSGFFENKQAEPLLEQIREGRYLLIQGRLQIGKFTNELELRPFAMAEGTALPTRKDTAAEKRVELHLHTRYSTMEATTDVTGAVKRAIAWGHPAIAITAHGIAQAFPEAYKAGKGKIKVILGCEAYYQNDVDDRLVYHGDSEQPLEEEIVCFDMETTGLSRRKDAITELGAVVLKNGEIIDRYSAFLNPGRPLTREIVQLTGITDDMIKDAPSQKDGLNRFLDWVGDRPLAAHNADFDTGFLMEGCRKIGRTFRNSYLDTLILCQNLLPGLGKYKLDVIAEHLNLPEFNHHRATDDAETMAMIFHSLTANLRDMGVNTLQQINPVMRTLRAGAGSSGRRRANHLILLAKNQTGLRNLYKLISLAHLEHFKRFPIMPKSLVEENREGLIVGSACVEGELFQAVVDGKSREELRPIANWYDFLEIQPICNNSYLLREGKADSDEDLRDFNRTVVELGHALNKPVCATGDVHFMDPEDEIYRHILLAAKQFKDADEPLPIYFKTTDKMQEEFSYLGEEECRRVVIEAPNRIASWVDRIAPMPQKLFAPKLKNSDEELKYLVYHRAHELYGEELPDIVQKRIDLELPGILNR